jgi:phosphoribosylformylglycinamidine synthase
VVGVVGKVEDGVKLVPGVFGHGGGVILLLGKSESGGLGASLYLQEVHEQIAGRPAVADLESEKKLHRLMRSVLKESGIRAAHDVGEGGILWALAEMTFGPESAGAEADLPIGSVERAEEALFGEGGGRILVEVDEAAVATIDRLAKEAGVGCLTIGKTGGKLLRVKCGGEDVSWEVKELRGMFEGSLPRALES